MLSTQEPVAMKNVYNLNHTPANWIQHNLLLLDCSSNKAIKSLTKSYYITEKDILIVPLSYYFCDHNLFTYDPFVYTKCLIERLKVIPDISILLQNKATLTIDDCYESISTFRCLETRYRIVIIFYNYNPIFDNQRFALFIHHMSSHICSSISFVITTTDLVGIASLFPHVHTHTVNSALKQVHSPQCDDPILSIIHEILGPIPLYLIKEIIKSTCNTSLSLTPQIAESLDAFIGSSPANIKDAFTNDQNVYVLVKKNKVYSIDSAHKIEGNNAFVDYLVKYLKIKPFDDIPPYYRCFGMRHFRNSKYLSESWNYHLFINVYYLYTDLCYFGTIENCLNMIEDFIQNASSNAIKYDFMKFYANLRMFENSIIGANISFQNFCTGIRCRLLFEQSNICKIFLHDLKSVTIPYIKPMFPNLKENSNIYSIYKCQSLIKTIKFINKEELIAILPHNLILLYNINNFTSTYKALSIDAINVVSNGKICIFYDCHWNIEQHGMPFNGFISKKLLPAHSILLSSEFAYSVGEYIDKLSLNEYNVLKRVECSNKGLIMDSKYIPEEAAIAVLLAKSIVLIFSESLNKIAEIRLTKPNIFQIFPIKNGTCLGCINNDGDIDEITIENGCIISSEAHFSSADSALKYCFYIDSKSLYGNIYSHSIKYKKQGAFIDKWEYYGKGDITSYDFSQEIGYLVTADTNSLITIFDITKEIEQRKALYIPSHKSGQLISNVDIYKLKDSIPRVISLSSEMELKVWARDSGKMICKYLLSSVIKSPATCLCSNNNFDFAFIGCADSNIYIIDVESGKLKLVFEGHWESISYLSMGAEGDQLISLAGSNLKIWDIKHYACIRSLLPTKTAIIFAKEDSTSEKLLLIDQSGNFKKISSNDSINSKYLSIICIVCADILENYMLILTSQYLIVHNFISNYKLHEISIQGKVPVKVKGVAIEKRLYAIVLFKTECIIFIFDETSITQVAQYYLNIKIAPTKEKPSFDQTYFNCICAQYLLNAQDGIEFFTPSVSHNSSKGIEPLENAYKMICFDIDALKLKTSIDKGFLFICIGDSIGCLHFIRVYHL